MPNSRREDTGIEYLPWARFAGNATWLAVVLTSARRTTLRIAEGWPWADELSAPGLQSLRSGKRGPRGLAQVIPVVRPGLTERSGLTKDAAK